MKASAARNRNNQIVSLLNDQASLLRPLKIDQVYGEFGIPCDGPFAAFCHTVLAFRNANPRGIMPVSLFDSFPGGRGTIILMSLRFFKSEAEATAQLSVYDDQKSEYSAYMQLPLIGGDKDVRSPGSGFSAGQPYRTFNL
ncbi:hypothetical protein [Mesorhizobium sp. LSHC422A00]|uniref:hypothetical protein n=1 Tax=Mesorhizobium sp. LSHC422A00 TaxID=1287294 RepID=UPI0012EB0F94|nr:hypothetical protein [Mesorhizobium sp. LSHC422A00]